MGSNYEVSYPVDLVFCIDCTGSMQHTLDLVKKNALNLYGDLQTLMTKKGKKVSQIRIRVIAFRDYVEQLKDGQPAMLATKFFTLPGAAEDFAKCVRGLEPVGGGDDDEDGLEALGFAMSSDWDMSSAKCRHIIVLWTDAAPHELGFGRSNPAYPAKMAKDMAELTAWWGDGAQANGKMPNKNARRLLLYAPDQGNWKFISDNWQQVIHNPTALGDGVKDQNYEDILNLLANSI